MPSPARGPAVLPAPPMAWLLVRVRPLAVRVLPGKKPTIDRAAATHADVEDAAAARVAAASQGLVVVEGAVRDRGGRRAVDLQGPADPVADPP